MAIKKNRCINFDFSKNIQYSLWIRCNFDIHRIAFFWEKNQMEAVVFQSRALIRFPNFVSFRRRPIFDLKDIADGYPYPSKSIQLSVSSNGADGNAGYQPPRRTRKNEHSSKKTPKNEEGLQKPKSKNQEEIIALFRKIQTSIAKESATTDDDDSNKDENGVQSILETLLESRKQMKGTKISKRAGIEVLTKPGTTEEKEMPDQTLPAIDFKLTRPPSNFVKRSPIPSSTGENGLLNGVDESKAISESRELKFPSIDNMKLTELKALAKSRGIKGYSKLKKNELLEILRS